MISSRILLLVFMCKSLFTGKENVEETLYICNNNNWISIYEESDVEEDRIWIEENRSRKDIEPLCGEE